MKKMVISIPEEIRKEIRIHSEVDWNKLACDAFWKKIKEANIRSCKVR